MKHTFVLHKRKIIVFAIIKGIKIEKKFKFILDTGASKSLIDEHVASSLGFDIKKMKSGDRLMTMGGGKNSKIMKLPKISLFGKEISNFEVNVFAVPSQILFFADGLIGMDFLLNFKTFKIDFETTEIETD
jgi:clan AA aspartic protease (TIGR02281 family)